MALPKGSPLLPFFNHAYNKLRQNGALPRIKAKWEDNSLKCEATSLEPISIEKMGSLLVMLLSGMGLASIILVLENFCKTQALKASLASTPSPRITRFPLERIPLTRILAYVRASGGYSALVKSSVQSH